MVEMIDTLAAVHGAGFCKYPYKTVHVLRAPTHTVTKCTREFFLSQSCICCINCTAGLMEAAALPNSILSPHRQHALSFTHSHFTSIICIHPHPPLSSPTAVLNTSSEFIPYLQHPILHPTHLHPSPRSPYLTPPAFKLTPFHALSTASTPPCTPCRDSAHPSGAQGGTGHCASPIYARIGWSLSWGGRGAVMITLEGAARVTLLLMMELPEAKMPGSM
jgi:hypothetical protein